MKHFITNGHQDFSDGARNAMANGGVKREGLMLHHQKSPRQPLVAAADSGGHGQQNPTVPVDQDLPAS